MEARSMTPDPLALELWSVVLSSLATGTDSRTTCQDKFLAAATRILARARAEEAERSAKYHCAYCERGLDVQKGVGDHWEHRDGSGAWSIWCDSAAEKKRLTELRKVSDGK